MTHTCHDPVNCSHESVSDTQERDLLDKLARREQATEDARQDLERYRKSRDLLQGLDLGSYPKDTVFVVRFRRNPAGNVSTSTCRKLYEGPTSPWWRSSDGQVGHDRLTQWLMSQHEIVSLKVVKKWTTIVEGPE